MKNLRDYQPQPHPLKPVFRNHKIPQTLLGRIAGYSQGKINLFLNGYQDIPTEAEKKLTALAKQLEKRGGMRKG